MSTDLHSLKIMILILIAAPRLWNKLPALVKSSVSLTQFKKNLKTHLFNQVFEKMVWFLPFDVFFDIAFVLYFSSTCSGFLLSLGLRFNFGYCTCKYYSLYLAPWALWWICALYKFSLLFIIIIVESFPENITVLRCCSFWEMSKTMSWK